jgi:hypothetical protein
MSSHAFDSQLWERDLKLLATGHQELARDALQHARERLDCIPYHRKSKATASSDRQTLLRHPRTGQVCLVLSVVPSRENRRARALRVDFFDHHEQVRVDPACGEVIRAARTQWDRKGERRVYVSHSASPEVVHALLASVVKNP